MKIFFCNNINELINDDVFIGLIKKIATGSISHRNLSENFIQSGIPMIFSVPDDNIKRSNLGCNKIDLMDYTLKSKAKKLIAFDIGSKEILKHLQKNYNLKLFYSWLIILFIQYHFR